MKVWLLPILLISFIDKENGKWFGVDIEHEDICDTFQTFVWEPALVKINAITAATEAASIILSVDETIKNEASEKPNQNPLPGPQRRGRR